MEFFKKIFRRKREAQTKPQPLRIEGCKTTLTPKPDEAELAAQALLESLSDDTCQRSKDKSQRPETLDLRPQTSDRPKDAAYYRDLSEKIRKARAAEKRQAMRFVAYAEQQLESPLFTGELDDIERELYRLQDVAEREGGELLRRWQHCLAECIVKQMSSNGNLNDNEETTM